MIVGLPGTGIGGLFYLLASTWMPVQETLSAPRRRLRFARWRNIAKMVFITLAIAAGFWLTGHLVGMLIVMARPSTTGISAHATFGLLSDGRINILSANVLYWALGTLGVLYVGMHALRLVLRLSGLLGQTYRTR